MALEKIKRYHRSVIGGTNTETKQSDQQVHNGVEVQNEEIALPLDSIEGGPCHFARNTFVVAE